MPSLCTVGICLATGKPQMALGAFCYFLPTSRLSLLLGSVSLPLWVPPPAQGDKRWHGLRRPMITSAALVLAVAIPLLALTFRFVGEGPFRGC